MHVAYRNESYARSFDLCHVKIHPKHGSLRSLCLKKVLLDEGVFGGSL